MLYQQHRFLISIITLLVLILSFYVLFHGGTAIKKQKYKFMYHRLNLTMKNAICWRIFIFITVLVNSNSVVAVEFTAPNWQAFSWKKIVEKKGVVIETAKFNQSRFTAVKSSMLVDARLNDVTNLVLFIDGCHEKSTVCDKIENIGSIDQQNYYQYVVSKFPWPLKKRDMFLKIRVQQEKISGIITVQGRSYQDGYGLNNRYIRIKDMDLQWKLIPQKQGGVLIEHYIHSDPGGIIPAWLFNDAVSSIPLATLGNIKRLLNLPKYQQRDVPFIVEHVIEQKVDQMITKPSD